MTPGASQLREEEKRMYRLLLPIGLLLWSAPAWAQCGKQTRQRVDSVRCTDAKGDTWYELTVNKLCGTHSGVEQTVLEIVETTPERSRQRVTIFERRLKYVLYKHKDDDTFTLFERGLGKKASLEARALKSQDGTSIDAVRLEIHPKRGEACTKDVDVTSVWGTWLDEPDDEDADSE